MRLSTLLDRDDHMGAVAATVDGNDVFQFLPCRREDAELWFAERSGDIERAKTLCRTCPLQSPCLEGALDRGEPWGVWGGEVLVDGQIVANKRGRGRPRKVDQAREGELAG